MSSQTNVISNCSNFGPRRTNRHNNLNDYRTSNNSNFQNNTRPRRSNNFNNFNNNRIPNRNRPNQNPLHNTFNQRTSNNVGNRTIRRRNNFNTNNLRNAPQQPRHFAKKHTEEEEKEALQALQALTVYKHCETQSLIRDYEKFYKIPLLLYMYDIMASIRISNEIQSENIQILLPLLPCDGGIFRNLWRRKQSSLNGQHFLTDNKINIHREIQQILTLSRQTYATNLQQIPLPKYIKFKVNGIWETDVKIIRAFNKYLHQSLKRENDKDNPVFDGAQCEYHLRIWCNGLIKVQQQPQANVDVQLNGDGDGDDDSDSSDDDDEDDPYQQYEAIKTEKDDDFYPCDMANIDIAKVMQQNKKKLNIKEIKRRKNKNDSEPEHKFHAVVENDCVDFDSEYESIDSFVQRVCDKVCAEFGHAIMILIDTRHDPNVCVYVWRKKITRYDTIKHNINIGENRLHYKKEKYFELPYENSSVNVGQYIGLSTCILDGYIHQFWSIFDRELRFEPVHAHQLWPDFYENQTLFEVKTNFNNDYAEKDEKKQEKYKRFYGNELINKLDNEENRFDYQQIIKIEEEAKNKLEKSNHKNNNNNFDDNSDGLAPDLTEYGPFDYHKIKSHAVYHLKQDLKDPNRLPIPDLSPKQYKIVNAHAKAHKFKDVPNPKKDDS